MYNLGKGLNGKILGNSLPQLKKKKKSRRRGTLSSQSSAKIMPQGQCS